jgi:hypothetical protein
MSKKLSQERLAKIHDIYKRSNDQSYYIWLKRQIPDLLSHIASLEVEIERLRDVANMAAQMRSACSMDWTHGDCRDSQCAPVCCALNALEAEVGE